MKRIKRKDLVKLVQETLRLRRRLRTQLSETLVGEVVLLAVAAVAAID